MPAGTVKWFNVDKGFGFIQPDDGSSDVFAHYSNISDQVKELTVGQRVNFDVANGRKGLQAENISSS